MASLRLHAAVSARLAEGWAGAPVVAPNAGKATAPATGAPYVLVQYPYSSSSQITFGAPGANYWREEGAIRFVIHLRRGDGLEDGLAWADEIAALFRGKEFEGVQTFAPSSPLIDDANENGKYYLISFAVPYQIDLVG